VKDLKPLSFIFYFLFILLLFLLLLSYRILVSMAILLSVVLLILVSKELLVFNAETLVLICFASFVGRVAISGRDGIVGFFEARETQIKKETEQQRAGLESCLTEYRNALASNKDRVERLSGYRVLYYQAVEARKEKATKDVEASTVQYCVEQLKRRVTLETKVFGARQSQRSQTVPNQVFAQLSSGKRNTEERLDGAIKELEEEGQYDWSFTPEWAEDDGWFYCCDDQEDQDRLSIIQSEKYDAAYAASLATYENSAKGK
jgi:hypothetical protein